MNEQDHPRTDAFGWVKLVADLFAMTVVPLCRKDFGAEGIGAPGAGAAIIIVSSPFILEEPLSVTYCILWILALLWHHRRRVLQEWQGLYQHSRYNGFPFVVFALNPFLRNERGAKLVWEPLLWLTLGLLAQQIDYFEAVKLGEMFVAAAGGIFVSTAIDMHIDRMRVRRMRDAMIEQQQLADWYRAGHIT